MSMTSNSLGNLTVYKSMINRRTNPFLSEYHTHTHTQTDMQTHTHTKQTQGHTQIHTQTDTRTHIDTHIYTNRHTDTHTHRHTYTHRHRHTHIHVFPDFLQMRYNYCMILCFVCCKQSVGYPDGFSRGLNNFINIQITKIWKAFYKQKYFYTSNVYARNKFVKIT
jgi:hypothetical protein